MVPLPGGCVAENAHSMRTDFLPNNRFTYGFFMTLMRTKPLVTFIRFPEP